VFPDPPCGRCHGHGTVATLTARDAAGLLDKVEAQARVIANVEAALSDLAEAGSDPAVLEVVRSALAVGGETESPHD
jgi:hypothetical protein